MSKEATKGEAEARIRKTRADKTSGVDPEIAVPSPFSDDPYDLAHPCHVDPTANTPLPEPNLYERQALSAKQNRTAFIRPPTFKPDRFKFVKAADELACSMCGVWPCERMAGWCPDYLAVSEKGLGWLRKEHRLETVEEFLGHNLVPWPEDAPPGKLKPVPTTAHKTWTTRKK